MAVNPENGDIVNKKWRCKVKQIKSYILALCAVLKTKCYRLQTLGHINLMVSDDYNNNSPHGHVRDDILLLAVFLPTSV